MIFFSSSRWSSRSCIDFFVLRCCLCTLSWTALSLDTILIDLPFYTCLPEQFMSCFTLECQYLIVSSKTNFTFVAALHSEAELRMDHPVLLIRQLETFLSRELLGLPLHGVPDRAMYSRQYLPLCRFSVHPEVEYQTSYNWCHNPLSGRTQHLASNQL
jgi:hypothetical protein